MGVEERRLDELIVESEDLQSDSMRETRAALRDLRDLRAGRGGSGGWAGRPGPGGEVDPAEAGGFLRSRRRLLVDLGARGVFAGVLGGGLGSVVATLLARPASAASGLDIQILQTASSLERLAINAYTGIVALPFVKNGNKLVLKFAQTTLLQHDAHRKAFQSQTTALGGQVQDSPNPHYAPTVTQTMATLKVPADVLRLAATLEMVARDTYLSDLAQLTDLPTRTLLAGVMGVESQHLAILRTVQSLIQGGTPQLVATPVDINALPAMAGGAAFGDGSLPLPTVASPPAEGALQ